MKTFLKDLRAAAWLWYDKDADHLAATISYYAILAVPPLILLSVTIMSFLYPKEVVVDLLLAWGTVLGPGILTLLTDATAALSLMADRFTVPLIGTIFFSGMVIVLFNTLTSGLHHLWDIPHRGIYGWLVKCRRSVLFTFVFEGYLIGLLAFGLVLQSLSLSPLSSVLLSTLFFVVASTLFFLLAYSVLPDRAPSLRARVTGAFIASVLLAAMKVGTSFYLSLTPFPGLYGAAGLIVTLLLWIFVAAAVFYFGAAVAKTRA